MSGTGSGRGASSGGGGGTRGEAAGDPGATVTGAGDERGPDLRLDRLRRLATVMDAGIRLPGTRFRFGLDPVLGLLPGLGDAAGAALSIWILVAAVRRGASRVTLVRIATTIAIDALLGVIPLVGDVFDIAWKANLRSVALLERHLSDPVEARRADGLFVALLGGSLLLLCIGLIAGGALLMAWIVRAVIAR